MGELIYRIGYWHGWRGEARLIPTQEGEETTTDRVMAISPIKAKKDREMVLEISRRFDNCEERPLLSICFLLSPTSTQFLGSNILPVTPDATEIIFSEEIVRAINDFAKQEGIID